MTAARNRPYQRRRRLPVIVIVSTLAVAAVATWTVVLLGAAGPAGLTACSLPLTGPPAGEVLAADALDSVAPVPAGSARVRVLNAGGQRGQANLVAAQLDDLGFAQAAPPANDPFYPSGDMDCTGQVRFGPAGAAAASTVALVLPCAELVRDDRTDDTVDVAVGTAFGDLNPVRAVRDVLDRLAGATGGNDGSANADPNATDTAPAPPPAVDPQLLAEARDSTC